MYLRVKVWEHYKGGEKKFKKDVTYSHFTTVNSSFCCRCRLSIVSTVRAFSAIHKPSRCA